MTEDYVTEHPIIDALRKWICETYQLIYTKHFKLYLDEDDYGLGIEMGNFERPIIIAGQFTSDDAFLTYIKKEFAFKQLYRIPLFSAAKQQLDELDFIFPTEDIPVAELIENRQIRQIQNEHNS